MQVSRPRPPPSSLCLTKGSHGACGDGRHQRLQRHPEQAEEQDVAQAHGAAVPCKQCTGRVRAQLRQLFMAVGNNSLSWLGQGCPGQPAPAERPAAQTRPAQLRCAPADEGSQSSASDSLSTSFPPSTSASASGGGWIAALLQLPGLLLLPLSTVGARPSLLPPLAARAPLLPFAGGAAAAPLPQ